MMCTNDGDTFFSFTKNTWIGDSGKSCHIKSDDTSFFDIINIIESIQGSSGIMPPTKKGKLHVNTWHINRTEQVHTLRPVKFYPKAGMNLFSWMHELLQGEIISNDHQKYHGQIYG